MAKNWVLDPLNARNPSVSGINPPTWASAAGPATRPSFPYLSSSPSAIGYLEHQDVSTAPTQLCRWTIHIPHATGDAICKGKDLVQVPPMENGARVFTDELHQSITSNSFTNTSVDDLPIATDEVTRAIEKDPAALEVDAWKLAIMAGNCELLGQLFEENGCEVPKGLSNIHPFHLAASFIDGGHTCCMPFIELSFILGPSYAFSHNVDNLGHTILDTLLVSIIRSHTSLSPDTVSFEFQSPNRFPGEEKDICGRWDLETEKVRHLFQQGFPSIPNKWKHPFCHTAAQAICHSIIAIFGPACAPNINQMSGLFIRRYTECGMELRPGPLHTLVFITFYLAQQGMPGETLFGALAVLVCLLSLGADVSLEADISVEEILGDSELRKVPAAVIDRWTGDCKTGWNSFAQVLVHAEMSKGQESPRHSDNKSENEASEDGDNDSESNLDDDSTLHHCELDILSTKIHRNWLKLKCHNAEIGLLWATIQAELLTYRRIRVGDAWLSENFSMEALEAWLKGTSAVFSTPLVQDQMLREYSRCGWFFKASQFVCPAAKEVSAWHFMNMDSDGGATYGRATFIAPPDINELWVDVVRAEEM
ncbi:hypothetical protein E0Z10_g4127 [Xylaria hypoxylon]|uniref:Uncharacterized protein n=1 Tax=Xylaria hypoxylon TaxID=37992 RepID=A0A4Z0YYV6_9PEZI|nr:hypothetical protein E0Z10_g4127 [Xylaria hypoxylon]